MDSNNSKKTNIFKFFFKIFSLLFFIFSLLYIYWMDWNKILFFSENNKSFSILYLLLFFYSFFFLFFINFFNLLEDADISKSKKPVFFIKFIYLILFALTLFPCPFINSYYRFFLIISNILIVFILIFSGNKILIGLIKYTIKRKINYFLPVFLFSLVLNISISVNISLTISLEQSKYLFGVEIKDQWWQFFLLSLVNCLCSVIESTGDMNLIIIIALATTINSILFFISSLILAQSISFTIKNRNHIFLTETLNPKIDKKDNYIYLNRELLPSLNIQRFKKEFWNKFSDYYDLIEETKVENTYFFNFNENIDNVLDQVKKESNKIYKLNNKIEELNKLKNEKKIKKLNNKIEKLNKKINKKEEKKFNKYIKINDEEKNKNLIKFSEKLRNNSLILNNFQQLYEIKIAKENNDGNLIREFIYSLSQKYSITIDKRNDKKINLFSLKNNLDKLQLLDNLDLKKMERIYYFKSKVKQEKLDKTIIKKLNLKILNDENKSKKVIFLDLFSLEDRTEKIRQELFNNKNNLKCFSELRYRLDYEAEKEQVWIQTQKTKWFYSKIPFWVRLKKFWIKLKNFWIKFWTKFWTKLKKFFGRKNKESSVENSRKSSNEEKNNLNETHIHKLIITTNKEGKINQSFKNQIYDLIRFDNIVNFEEVIYLSKNSKFKIPMEKHSFQFLVKNFFNDKEELKKFKDLMNKQKNSYNKYKFLNEYNDLEWKVIPINDEKIIEIKK